MKSENMFRRLSAYERSLSSHRLIADLLESELERVCEKKLSPLQCRTSVVWVGAAYRHFGFALFSPLGRHLLGRQLQSFSGADGSLLCDWLDAVCFGLLEDFNLMKIVTGEPDWDGLDRELALEIWKRLFCSDESESELLGLDLLDERIIQTLRQVSSECVSDLVRGQVSDLPRALPDHVPSDFIEALPGCVERISFDSLCLFLWRIECFSQFNETRQEFKFVYREGGQVEESALYRVAALLVVLGDIRTEKGEPLFLESPAPNGLLEKVLLGKDAKTQSLVRGSVVAVLLGSDPQNIRKALELALQMGLLFTVKPTSRRQEYGLTALGRKILHPYRGLVREAVLGGESEEPQSGQLPECEAPKMSRSAEEQGPEAIEKSSSGDMAAFLSEIQKESSSQHRHESGGRGGRTRKRSP